MACRIAFLFYELITKDSYLNIDDLSEELMVSRSTVNNDLKKAKELLKKYNARIKGVPNKGIHFVGDEFSKRLVLIHEVFDYFPIMPQIDRDIITIIQDLTLQYGLGYINKHLLFKSIMVSVHRAKEGHAIAAHLPMYKNFEKNSSEMKWFKEELERLFSYELKDDEIDFITFPINIRTSAYTDNLGNENDEVILKEIVTQMIERVQKRFMIHVDEEEFFSKVKYHLLFLINRLVFRIPVKDIFTDQIKIRFPLAFELAKTSMYVLQEKYIIMGTKVDISYLAVYYALVLDERKMIVDKRGNRRIAIVTDRGRGIYELIRHQLHEIVGEGSVIDLLTVRDFRTRDLSKYQMIFTPETSITDSSLPVIYIEGIVDQEYLSKRISEIDHLNQSPLEELKQLTDIHVKVLGGKFTYLENVRRITDDLKNEGIASSEVYERFVEKESLSSMIYDNGVAFPHLTDEKCEEISLTLGIVNPVSDKIRLIFFLLIPETMDERQEAVLMSIYDQIFSIVSDAALIRKLHEIESAVDLTTIHMEGN